VGLITLVGLAKTLIVIIAGHFLLEGENIHFEDFEKRKSPGFNTTFKESLKNSRKTIIRIFKVMVPVTVLVFILTDLGVFDSLGSYLKPISEYLPVPVEGLPIIAALFASRLAAYTLSASLMEQGNFKRHRSHNYPAGRQYCDKPWNSEDLYPSLHRNLRPQDRNESHSDFPDSQTVCLW